MNKKELIDQLEALGMRPGRGLGQNFLLDSNLLDWIVRNCGASAGERVLEVGPGFGALTEKLISANFNVTAIEYDHRLADFQRKKFGSAPNFKLIEADACKVDYSELFPPKTSYRSVANLPYAISSVFIAKLLDSPNPPQSMFFMLQKEMGERLAAVPGTKAYGALSVRTQLLYDVAVEKIVPPQVFCPPPEVDSALVSFKLRQEKLLPGGLEKSFTFIVRELFNQRRKQIGKLIGKITGKENAAKILDECGFAADLRPDKLTVADFVTLTQKINEYKGLDNE